MHLVITPRHLILVAMAAASATGCAVPTGSPPLVVPLAPTPSTTPTPAPPSLRPPPTLTLPTPSPTHLLPTETPTVASFPLRARLLNEITIDGGQQLQWAPAGDSIAVTTTTGVLLLSAATLQQTASHATSQRQLAAAFSPDGRSLATADHWVNGQRVHLWQSDTLALLWERDLPGNASAELLAFLPSGDLIDISSELGLAVWQFKVDGTMSRTLEIDGVLPQQAAVHPLKGWIAVPGAPTDYGLRIHDLRTGELLYQVERNPTYTAFAREAGVVLLDRGFAIDIWFPEQDRDILQVPVENSVLLPPEGRLSPTQPGISVNYDDTLFAAATEIPSIGIGVWELQTARLLGVIPYPRTDSLASIAFSPITNQLTILSRDGALQLWELTLSTLQ